MPLRLPPWAPVVLLFLLLALVPAAQAHAVYASSEPPQGARLVRAPDEVLVTLTEPIEPSGSDLQVFDQDGVRVDDGDVRFDLGQRPVLRVGLPSAGDGAYTVSWRALSGTDGHTTGGSFGFAVGAYDPPGTASQEAVETTAAKALRGLSYLGFSVAAGGLVFLFLGGPPAERRPLLLRVTAAGGALYALAVALLLAETRQTAGLGFAAFVTEATVGQTLLGRLVAGLLVAGAAWTAATAPPIRRDLRTGAAAAGLVGAALLSARMAHSSLHGLRAVVVDALHFLAAGAWVGGLLVFVLLLRGVGRRDEDALALGARFGRLAFVLVVLLAVSGVASSLLILGRDVLRAPTGALDSAYGRVLAAKVALALAMVGVAAANRFWLVGHLRRRDPARGARLLPRLVAVEAVFGVVVLALAGILTALAPGAAGPVPQEVVVEGEGEAFHVRMVWDPPPEAGVPAHAFLEITALADGARVVEDTCGRQGCVRVELVPLERPELGAQSVLAQPTDGAWWLHNVLLVAGPHEARVHVQTADVYLDEVRLEFTVPG